MISDQHRHRRHKYAENVTDVFAKKYVYPQDDHQASGKRCRNVSVALPAMFMQSIAQDMFPGFHLSGHRGMNECLGFGSYISVHSYAQCALLRRYEYCTLAAVAMCLFAHPPT